jgi:serine phosphatase RsbU (regulator of sigma subunit)
MSAGGTLLRAPEPRSTTTAFGTRRPGSLARIRRRAVLGALTGCALFPAGISTAVAGHWQPGPQPVQPAGGQSPAAHPGGAHGQPAPPPPPPPPSPVGGQAPAGGASPPVAVPTQQNADGGAHQGTAPQARPDSGGNYRQRASTQTQRGGSTRHESVGPQAQRSRERQGEQAQAQESLGSHERRSGATAHTTSSGSTVGVSSGSSGSSSAGSGSTSPGSSSSGDSSSSGAETSAAAGTTPAVATSATATPAVVATPAATTPTTATPAVSSVATSTPAALAASGQSAQARGSIRGSARSGRGGRRSHRGVRAGSAATTPGHAAAAGSTPGAIVPVGGAALRTARTARSAAARSAAVRRSYPSPLSTTITKIVDVVPAPLRILVGLLVSLALALGVRSRLAALRARQLERQRGELLEDVGLLQAALLPVAPARLGPVGTTAAYRPADGPGAGGDFYDVFALDDGRLAVILGDISGHGRQALPHTALVRFTLRAYLEAGLSPRLAVQTAGTVLARQLGESFATVVAATYDPGAHTLVYACAGHPPPLVLGARSLAPVTVCSSPPVGTGMPTGTRQSTVAVPGRAQICFYTDGVTEARVAGELFGSERLARALAELGPQANAPALLERVTQETDARPDDMAACLLQVPGDATAAPAVVLEELELDRDALAGERAARFLRACGVQDEEIAELIGSARAAAGSSGRAILEVRPAGARPRATLREDNLARLRPPVASAPVAVAGAR